MGFDRYAAEELRDRFRTSFGQGSWRQHLYVQAPGRTELAGNHTDHEGGDVIAAAVDRYVRGIFSPNEEDVIRVESEGYGITEIHVDELAARADERNTTASLIRGLAACFAERGYTPQGFDAYLCSGVPAGSGLSSSAAFELEVAQGMNVLWAKGLLAPEDLALMAQRAEREWFGKPCGLMDQAAVALGGIQHMSFATPGVIDAHAIDFDFAEAGFAICLVDVGADHAANTDDYAAVPAEMQAVARALGAQVLSEVEASTVIEALPRLRAELGDRAVLRALHYYNEEQLVSLRREALQAKDIERFLTLTASSGASSAMLLQNVSVGGASSQPSMLAIALAESILVGRGAARVHGGGFGGTIQAFVPLGMVEEFSRGMDAVFGEGACGVYNIEHEGASTAWL